MMYEYSATVERVVDGDTVDLDIDLGLDVHVHERCRLYGINAPEMKGESREAGMAAWKWLVGRIVEERDMPAHKLAIRTIKDKKGKYGRYLAVLYVDGVFNVNEEMVEAGHAVEYML